MQNKDCQSDVVGLAFLPQVCEMDFKGMSKWMNPNRSFQFLTSHIAREEYNDTTTVAPQFASSAPVGGMPRKAIAPRPTLCQLIGSS